MPLSIQDWHNRFQIQAQWTKALRLYFFGLLKNERIEKILDIGCGTGVLIPDLQSLTPAEIYGADLKLDRLNLAKDNCPETTLLGADVHQLPFRDSSFDMILCHYFLLWVGNPGTALQEMRRVTKAGGYIVAFAEPDYGGRIDFPTDFYKIRDYQISGLLNAGADPKMGRKLKSLFTRGGFSAVVSGVYEGSWQDKQTQEDIDSEWMVLEEDLSGLLNEKELKALKKHDLVSRENGSRLIYVPTFYAWGVVEK
ncbi:MAG: methyltransferase domain-containing protein [Anaerolineales bacterium]|nr:methyltransferase domain-containing protein [Anaerolineales bacterium]